MERCAHRTCGSIQERMRVLQIGADRSKRGIMYPGAQGYQRQKAYAEAFGELDIIALCLRSDDAHATDSGALHIHPTNSSTRFSYLFVALRLSKKLPQP